MSERFLIKVTPVTGPITIAPGWVRGGTPGTFHQGVVIDHERGDEIIWRNYCDGFPCAAALILEHRAAGWLDEHHPGWRNAAASESKE